MRAVITGATSGIGEAITTYLSGKGWDLILTGRNEAKLKEMQNALKGETDIIALDLAEDRAPYRLYEFCKGKDVDVLINNAGFAVFGDFSETPLDKELELINVNIRAVHILTKLFLRDFKVKNRGRIMNVASSAGFMPGPLLSSYYASKSYVLRLTQAIREELRRSGSKVRVSAFCPGPVATEFNSRAGVSFSMPQISAKYAAEYAIDEMFKGRTVIVPTLKMQALLFGCRFAPDCLVSAVAYEIQKRKIK